jgi:hypothetical protein
MCALSVVLASYDNIVPNIYTPNFYVTQSIHACSAVLLIVDSSGSLSMQSLLNLYCLITTPHESSSNCKSLTIGWCCETYKVEWIEWLSELVLCFLN